MIISLCLSKRQKGVLIKLELARKTNVHICSFDFFAYYCFNLTFQKNSDQKEKHFWGRKYGPLVPFLNQQSLNYRSDTHGP